MFFLLTQFYFVLRFRREWIISVTKQLSKLRIASKACIDNEVLVADTIPERITQKVGVIELQYIFQALLAHTLVFQLSVLFSTQTGLFSSVCFIVILLINKFVLRRG